MPDAYVERRALIGPPERIRERYRAWAESGVTGMTVNLHKPEEIELMADIAAETPAIGPAAAWAALTPRPRSRSSASARPSDPGPILATGTCAGR